MELINKINKSSSINILFLLLVIITTTDTRFFDYFAYKLKDLL